MHDGERNRKVDVASDRPAISSDSTLWDGWTCRHSSEVCKAGQKASAYHHIDTLVLPRSDVAVQARP